MNLPPAPELDDAALERRPEARARRYDHLGRAALTWLALVPEWTDELAERCGFPADGPVIGVRRPAKAAALVRDPAGWIDRADALLDARPARDQFLRDTKAQPRSRVALADTAATVAGLILAADVRIAPAIRNWAEIAQLGADGAVRGGDELARICASRRASVTPPRRSTGSPRARSSRPCSAATWARPPRVGAAGVDLEYRRRQDVRVLEQFVERPAEIEAPPSTGARARRPLGAAPDRHGRCRQDDAVALSQRRVRGRARLPPFPVGRVDFDHIDPRYPWTAA